MRITLIITSLEAGGAQRVMTVMANYWAERGEDVTIITLSPESNDWYKLHHRVKRVGLRLISGPTHIAQAVRNNVQRVCCLRRELRLLQPHAVICFLDTMNVITLMASSGLGIPVIVSERTDPRQHHINLAWSALRALFYRHANAVVVQSNTVRDWASKFLRTSTVHVIPNPIKPMFNVIEHHSNFRGSGHMVVAMGRLGREKGFDLLIKAFGKCITTHSDWSLVILGEGRERRNLEILAADLRIADHVSIAGQVHEPAETLSRADLFVLSSRYEGFPNALLEAMACKLPVISTDCPSGPRDIVRDNVDGVLVPPNDVDALAAAMDRFMADQAERKRLGARAGEVIQRFSIERIMSLWEKVLMQACPQPLSQEGSATGGLVKRLREII